MVENDSMKNLRQHPRHKPDLQLNFQMVSTTGRNISFKIRDFSASGLGILTEDNILPEINFIFKYKEHKLLLELIWGMEKNETEVLNRYGLKLLSKDQNLVTLLKSELLQES